MTIASAPERSLPKSLGSLPPSVADRIERAVSQPGATRLATMLYGSQARLSAGNGSDIDLVELVNSEPHSYESFGVSVTQYVPAHLKAMASAGSLFVLHLKLEGLSITDPHGVLKRALGAYRQPSNYDSLRSELAA